MKQAIQIGDNVTNIIALPCVREVTKYETIPHEYCDMPNAHEYAETWLIYTLKNGQTARKGDWIVQHDRGTWNVYTDEHYNKVKEKL